MTKAKAKAPAIQDVKTSRAAVQSRRARIINNENEKMAPGRRVVHFDVPADTVDVNQLVEMLAQRLAPGQLIVGAGVGGSGGAGGGFAGAAGGINGTSLGGGGSYNSDKSKSLDASAKLAIQLPPIEGEMMDISDKLSALHNLISELSGALEPLLAFELDPEDSGESPVACSPAVSPHHRRLIDLGEGVQRAIVRLRYLQSRVRT